MKISHLAPFPIMIALVVMACHKDNLDQPPLGQLPEADIANKKGVEGLLIGAYSQLDGISTNVFGWGGSGSNWIYGSICGSEAYKGSYELDQEDIHALEVFIPTANNGMLADKWKAVYAGVQRANTVLRVLKKATDIKPNDRQRIAAEARFLRAHYHFEAIKMWGHVPFVDENVTYESDNFYLPNDTLIWPAIEDDFRFAMNNLPITMEAVGRANKYAAEAFLAKAYMFQHKYDLARPLLQDLIQNGVTAGGVPYGLLKNFADNFNPATKNSSESVFAVQNSVNDGSNGFNGNVGDVLNWPGNGGPGGCCGFFRPSQYLVNHFKTDPQTGLPDLDHFNDNNVSNDEGYLSSDFFTPYPGTLDPRLDWTVGRRGIPYRGWGPHPGQDWTIPQDYGGPYSPIKNTYSKEQQAGLSDASFWTSGSTATNINLIRFADLLLWAAEAEVEAGSLEMAREYVNRIRRRAHNPDGFVKKDDGTPAANYKVEEYTTPWTDPSFARKAIRYERMLELAMEGHRFFDLVRWGIADTEINGYFNKEKNLRNYMNSAVFTKNKNEVFPIPQTQIDLSVSPAGKLLMKQNPGY